MIRYKVINLERKLLFSFKITLMNAAMRPKRVNDNTSIENPQILDEIVSIFKLVHSSLNPNLNTQSKKHKSGQTDRAS